MSALDQLPEDLRRRIRCRELLRDDLLAIPQAEAEGWTVTFTGNGHWNNSCLFTRENVVVWTRSVMGYRGIDRLTYIKDVTVHATVLDALQNINGREPITPFELPSIRRPERGR